MNVLPFGDAVRHCSFHLFRFSAKGAAHARSFPPWSLSAVSLVTGLGLLSSTISNSSLQTSYVGKTMNSMKPENEKKKTLTAYSAWLGIFLWRDQRTNQHPKGTVKPHIPIFACSRCVICVSCSVYVILMYCVRKGSRGFSLNFPQINKVRKSDHTGMLRESWPRNLK